MLVADLDSGCILKNVIYKKYLSILTGKQLSISKQGSSKSVAIPERNIRTTESANAEKIHHSKVGDTYVSYKISSSTKVGETPGTTGSLGVGKLIPACRTNTSEKLIVG